MMGRCARILVLSLVASAATGHSGPVFGDDAQDFVLQQNVHIVDGFVEIQARIGSPVRVRSAWQVLTDLDGQDRYLPSMDSSLVLARTDNAWTVQQVFTTRLVLPWTFRTLLEFTGDPASHRLNFRQVSGSLHDFAGTWTISPSLSPPGVTIDYQARARLRQPIPGFIVRYIVKRHLAGMLEALSLELITDPAPVALGEIRPVRSPDESS